MSEKYNMKTKILVLIVPVLIWGTSCGKNIQIKENFSTTGDVYVAGTVDGKAVLWKNGELQFLSDGILDSEAKSIYVSGDVYVAGNIGSNAVLWKNGVMQKLSDDGDTNSVYVSGGDVYVAGRIGSYAVLWKNGIAQILSDETLDAEAKSVFISGNDVFVVGNKFWKNGVVQKLTDGSEHPGGASVFVSGDDVYVAGTVYQQGYPVATVWKNGVAQHLTHSESNLDSLPSEYWASSIYVSGNDVYVAGGLQYRNSRTGFRYGKLWKIDGDTSDISEFFEATIYSVYVSENDIYLAGRQVGKGPVVWKNGIEQYLNTNGLNNSLAYSVFVVR